MRQVTDPTSFANHADGQSSHSLLPADALYLPLVQFVHSVAPSALLYVPASHLVHALLAGLECVPLVHTTHVSVPVNE